MTALDPLASTSVAFADAASAHGVARGTALDVYRRYYRSGEAEAPWLAPTVLTLQAIEEEGPTRKLLLERGDGRRVETVILPQVSRTGRQRCTLCVSSQVGCAMGCTFCETATMGRQAQLEPADIVAQWHAARFGQHAPISNIVFMGMGEPMDNLDAVIPAIEVLVDHNGPAIPASRVTVSTVGHLPGMRRLRAFVESSGIGRLRLAVSVNASNDDVRGRLMPINRAAPMAALHEEMLAWTVATRSRVLVEYVLIPGENDQQSHARELAAWLGSLPCTVNVIPYNPRRNSPWPAPAEADVDRFVQQLLDLRVRTLRRHTRGRGVMAACGQLNSATPR